MPARQSRHSFQGESIATGGSVPRPGGHRPMTLIELCARLSPRECTIAVLLDAHRVLTSDQLTIALFDSARTCFNRLHQLRDIDFIARFRPITLNRHVPWHWVQGTNSARYMALHRSESPPTPKALALHQDATMVSPQLTHTVGANGFFIDLIAHSRTHPGTRLTRWWSAARTAAAFSRRIHPDGHGVWRDDGTDVGFFLEHDNGTEDHGRLVAKLDAYRRLRTDGGPDHPVLFWLPTARREAHLHARLDEAGGARGLIVATAARDALAGGGPADPVWWIAGDGPDRYALADLPSAFGEPGPYVPGPPVREDDPLHFMLPLAADID